jgi:hypothetical protein
MDTQTDMGTRAKLNTCEIARKIHGHACGFLVPCDIRLRANVTFSSLERGGVGMHTLLPSKLT